MHESMVLYWSVEMSISICGQRRNWDFHAFHNDTGHTVFQRHPNTRILPQQVDMMVSYSVAEQAWWCVHMFVLGINSDKEPPFVFTVFTTNTKQHNTIQGLWRVGFVFRKTLAFTFVPVGMWSVFSPGIEATAVC